VLATFLFAGRWRGVGAVFGAIGGTLFFENGKYFLLMTRTVADRRRNRSRQLSLFESSS
jgi:hypothetical protein